MHLVGLLYGNVIILHIILVYDWDDNFTKNIIKPYDKQKSYVKKYVICNKRNKVWHHFWLPILAYHTVLWWFCEVVIPAICIQGWCEILLCSLHCNNFYVLFAWLCLQVKPKHVALKYVVCKNNCDWQLSVAELDRKSVLCLYVSLYASFICSSTMESRHVIVAWNDK